MGFKATSRRCAALLVGMCLAGAAHANTTLVTLGDSLTAGYGLPEGAGFAGQLQAALDKEGCAVTVVDAGVSGDTSSGGLSRLEWSVPAKADAVIVELGANDALRGIDPEITRKSLSEIVRKLKVRGQKVLLAGMRAPPNLGDDYAGRFNAIYPEIAEQQKVALYPFFLEGVAAQRELNQGDGIHPTREGVARIVANILPQVRELVATACQGG